MSQAAPTRPRPTATAKSAIAPKTRRIVNIRLLLVSLAVIVVCGVLAGLWHHYQSSQVAGTFLQHATALEEEGKWPQAANYLARYLQLEPADTDARLRLLAAVEKSDATGPGRYRLVALLYQTLGELPERDDLRRKLAEQLLTLQDFAGTKSQASKLLETGDPETKIAARHILALATTAQARPDGLVTIGEAATALLAALADNPGDVVVASLTANIYRTYPELVGRDATPLHADQIMKSMVAANPQNVQALLARYRYRLQYDPEHANSDLAAALKLEPENVDALMMSVDAVLLARDKSRLEAAKKDAERVIAAQAARSARVPSLGAIARHGGRFARCGRNSGNRPQAVADSQSRSPFRARQRLVRPGRSWQSANHRQGVFRRSRSLAARAGDRRTHQPREPAHASSRRSCDFQRRPTASRAISRRSSRRPMKLPIRRCRRNWCSRMTRWRGFSANSNGRTWLQSIGERLPTACRTKRKWPGKPRRRIYDAGHIDVAIDQLEAYLQRPSANAEARMTLLLARLQRELGRPVAERNWQPFVESLTSLRTTSPDRWEWQLAEVTYVVTQDAAQGRQKGLERLQQIEKQFPQNAELVERLAVWYQQLDDKASVERVLDSYDKLQPNNTRRVMLRSAMLASQARMPDALALLEKSAKDATPAEASQFKLAQIQAAGGDSAI